MDINIERALQQTPICQAPRFNGSRSYNIDTFEESRWIFFIECLSMWVYWMFPHD